MVIHYDCGSTVCVFMPVWAVCSRSLKTHLRLSLIHVPSSSEVPSQRVVANDSDSAALFVTQGLPNQSHNTLPPTSPPCSPQQHSYAVCPWWEKDPSWRCWTSKILFRTVSPTQPFFFFHTHCRGCCVRSVIANLVTSIASEFACFFEEYIGFEAVKVELKFPKHGWKHTPYSETNKLSTRKNVIPNKRSVTKTKCSAN